MSRILAAAALLLAVAGTVWWQRARTAAPAPAPSSVAFRVVSGDSATQGHPLAEELCSALHLLPGRRVAECCGGPPRRFLYDQCVGELSRALSANAVRLRPEAVAACARDAEKELSGCDWVRPAQPLPAPACQDLLHGLVPAGGSCRSSLECSGTLHCSGASTAGAGRCAPPEPLGASCGASGDALAAYVMDQSADEAHPICRDFCSLVSHHCEPVPAPGSTCRASVNCAPGQHCAEGRCTDGPAPQRLTESGEACRTDFDCARGGCIGESGSKVCGMRCAASL